MKNCFLIVLLCVGGAVAEILQCQVVPKWTVGGKEIPHRKDGISVVGVLDAKCGMCIRQASMFNELKDRLTAHGMTNIDYNIVSMVNGISELKKLQDASPSIPVHQETAEDKCVETLGAGKDHFLIFDGCNRLVYQVIMPWSILTFPYVKAAILSAYNDKPCGECDGQAAEPQQVTVTVVKHIHKPLPQVFEATFTQEKERHFKKHHHHHHHHHHLHRHPLLGHHHHHHHHHHHPHKHHHEYHNFDTNQLTTNAQYDALKTFLANHLTLLDIHNQTFHVHSQGTENDYSNYYNVINSGSTMHTTTEHNKESDIFGNGYVYTDELTKVPQGIDPIRVEQLEGQVQEGHESISKDEILSENAVPLKIILWYPHYHIFNGERLKDHYYLVLNSRDPTYHGHVDNSDEKEFGGEKESHVGQGVVDTAHQSHEETCTLDHGQVSNFGGAHTLTSAGEEHGTVTGTTGTQFTTYGQQSGGHQTDHTVQTSEAHNYSFNTTHTQTSETHHQTFESGHSHTGNEISGIEKTDLHGKDTVSGIGHHETVLTTTQDHATGGHGVSHGQTAEHHGTVVTTTQEHATGGHGVSHGQRAEHHGTVVTTTQEHATGEHGVSHGQTAEHHDTVVTTTQEHATGEHGVSHGQTAGHHGTVLTTTQEHATGEHGVTHGETTNVHKTVHDTSVNTITHGGDIKTETHTDQIAEHQQHAISQGHGVTGGVHETGSQNQFGGSQSGSSSQSSSSAHGGVTHSQSGSHSSSHGGTTYSTSYSSSSSSSFGGVGQQGHEYSAGQHGQGISSQHGSVGGHTDHTSTTHGQTVGGHDSSYTAGGGSHGHTTTHESHGTTTHVTGQETLTHGSQTTGHSTHGESSGSHTTYGQTVDSHAIHGQSGHGTFGGSSVTGGGHSSSTGESFHGSSHSQHGESSHSSGSHSSYGQSSSSHGSSTHGAYGQSSHHHGESSHSGLRAPGEYDDRIIFRDDANEELNFHKFLEKYKKEHPEEATHLRTMDEEDVTPEQKAKDGEELINHYSKILPWIAYPVD